MKSGAVNEEEAHSGSEIQRSNQGELEGGGGVRTSAGAQDGGAGG